jgi:asparagine synthetase B (glutamine-hydrolysing)
LGVIGGLVSSAGLGREQQLIEALALSDRGKATDMISRGQATVGISSTRSNDAYLADGSEWTVSVSGVVDAVGQIQKPAQPASSIAKAFDDYGVSAAGTVLGEFTCVATDGRRLVAFRDHIGTDGLFVGTNGSVASVMSEPKQVAAMLGRSRKPDLDALVSVFFSQWEAKDDVPCVVDGVDRVPRGFAVEADIGGWRRIGRTWDPTDFLETSRLSIDEAAERAWDLVSAAVARSVKGPTAVSLSGGVDSTLIAASLIQVTGVDKIGAISAVYPESPSVDESIYISETVGQLGLRSTTYEPERNRLAELETWVDRFDGPTYGLAIGAVEEMNIVAANEGYQTILGGELAELVYDLREHALGRILQRGHVVTGTRQLFQLRGRGMSWSSLARILGASLAPSSLALAYVHRRHAEPPASWLEASYMPGLDRRWDLERSPSRRWSDIQLFFATGPSFPGLEVSTIMGDLAGVRTRRPLVDRQLWEFFLSLPPEVKFPDAWTKSLVRHALDGRAPDSVVWRRDKTVFDEDSFRRAEYPSLIRQVSDGFRLPGVRYDDLVRRLEGAEMTSFELSMARSLASIHTFMAVAS